MNPNVKKTGFNLAYVLLAAMGVLLLQDWWIRSQAVATIPYSQFQKLVREDKVARVVVSDNQIQGEYKEEVEGKKRFVTSRVEQDLAKELDEHGVEYAGRFENTVVPLVLSWVVPIALFFGLWMFIGRRMAKQLGGRGIIGHGGALPHRGRYARGVDARSRLPGPAACQGDRT